MNCSLHKLYTVDRRVSLGLLAVTLISAFTLSISLFASIAHSQPVKTIPFGAPVQGAVVDFKGEWWTFYGCRGDVITATMQSATFSPYLELAANLDQPSLAEQSSIGNQAQIGSFTLPTDGAYHIIAGPERRSDQGAYTLTLTLNDHPPTDVDGMVNTGETITGKLDNRFGNAWSFHGCQGQMINIAMTSAKFTPSLALMNATGVNKLAEGKAHSGTISSLIENFTLTNTAYYMLMASGSKTSDRGAYSLTLTLTNPATQTETTTDTTPLTNQATATSIPTLAGLSQAAALCTAKTKLNLRSGPSTLYAPVSTLAATAQLHPLARTAANDWLQVQILPGGPVGWVAAAYVTCNSDSSTLPLGVIPSTPTAVPPTAIPPTVIAQIPSPTPPAFLALQGGEPGGNFKGRMYTEQGMATDQGDNTYLFRNRMYFRLDVTRTEKNRKIDYVDFSIKKTDANGDETTVHMQKEGSAAYCSFGGGEPNCNVLALKPNAQWPSTHQPIENGEYRIDADVHLKGQNNSVNWSVNFVIDIPGQGGGGNQGNGNNQNGNQSQTALVLNIVQPAANTNFNASDTLIFQAEAYNPDVGSNDGDGIDHVDMDIFGSDGQQVYHHKESSAHYCAFSGGEPDCNPFDFTVGETRWSQGGPRVQSGPHTLRATVYAKDGRSVTREIQIQIQ